MGKQYYKYNPHVLLKFFLSSLSSFVTLLTNVIMSSKIILFKHRYTKEHRKKIHSSNFTSRNMLSYVSTDLTEIRNNVFK